MAALPDSVDVLIVGGGPTGLAAALALKKNGCTSLLVVDGSLASENSSRALVLHAATMEVGRPGLTRVLGLMIRNTIARH